MNTDLDTTGMTALGHRMREQYAEKQKAKLTDEELLGRIVEESLERMWNGSSVFLTGDLGHILSVAGIASPIIPSAWNLLNSTCLSNDVAHELRARVNEMLAKRVYRPEKPNVNPELEKI